MRALSLTACAVALLLIGPPVAVAQDNSAIDQYTESLPGAGGESRGDGSGSGGGEPGPAGDEPAAPLPAQSSAGLEAAGPDGAAAAALARATAPKPGRDEDKSAAAAADGDEAAAGAGASTLADVVAGDSAGGIGIALPIILAATLLGLAAVAVMRRRATHA